MYNCVVHEKCTHVHAVDKVDEFVNGRGKGKKIIGCHTMKDFAAALKVPRKAMIMVKAGSPVDQVIAQCVEVFEKGDIIIDGGNSHYPGAFRFSLLFLSCRF
jgi:6-phosphogluconate dehydrogenase